MGSDSGTSDDISAYLDLLEEIDKKCHARDMPGISSRNNEGFSDQIFVIGLKY
jgi:hypothetical protein